MVYQLRDVFGFLEWKMKQHPFLFTSLDTDIVTMKKVEKLTLLSEGACIYSKRLIQKYTEVIWQEALNNQLQIEGQSRFPSVSCSPIILPTGTSREDEVKLLSFFYKNNLLNAFLYTAEKKACPSPLCMCAEGEQTAFHLLTSCPLVDIDCRVSLTHLLMLGNEVTSEEALATDYVSVLNCSRDNRFIKCCLNVAQTASLHLRTKIKLSKSRS